MLVALPCTEEREEDRDGEEGDVFCATN